VTVAYVEADGARLWYEVAGSGPGVAFLHPGLWDLRTWDDQFGVFAERFRVLRHDARGYGRSSRPEPGRAYSHVDDLATVMDEAGLESAALIGCSMGGAIAVDFALTHPGRTTALVLVATALHGFDETQEEEAAYADLGREVEAVTEAGDLERSMDLELGVWAALGTDDERGGRIRRIAMDNLHERTMDESAQVRLDPPASDRLEEIACPTLVLPADHDPPVMRRIAHEIAQRVPNARLVEIPNTDHVLNMRRPDEFNRVVLAFLEEVT
jgi:pimeloyl-ACP methyl ester carboxylesterase